MSIGDQKVGGNDLSLIKVLFMLNTEVFHFSILLAGLLKFSSVRLDICRDCIQLKFLTLEKDPLKPNLFSVVSIMESTFSLLLDGRTKVIALASHPSGK